MLGRCKKQKQNADYKWRNVGDREGRAYLPDGPEEGYLSGRSIGQMVRWHHPGEMRTYLPRVTSIGGTRREVPLLEVNRSDGTIA